MLRGRLLRSAHAQKNKKPEDADEGVPEKARQRDFAGDVLRQREHPREQSQDESDHSRKSTGQRGNRSRIDREGEESD